jgi:hypothetical protein
MNERQSIRRFEGPYFLQGQKDEITLSSGDDPRGFIGRNNCFLHQTLATRPQSNEAFFDSLLFERLQDVVDDAQIESLDRVIFQRRRQHESRGIRYTSKLLNQVESRFP